MNERPPREGARWGTDPVPLTSDAHVAPNLPSQESIDRQALVERFGPDSVNKSIAAFYKIKYAFPDAPILKGGEISFAKGLLELINRHARDAASFGEVLTIPNMLDALIPVLENSIIGNKVINWNDTRINYGREYKKVHALWDERANPRSFNDYYSSNSTAAKKTKPASDKLIYNKFFWIAVFLISVIATNVFKSYYSFKFLNISKYEDVTHFYMENNTWSSGDILFYLSDAPSVKKCPSLKHFEQFSTDSIRIYCSNIGKNYSIHAEWAKDDPDLAAKAHRLSP